MAKKATMRTQKSLIPTLETEPGISSNETLSGLLDHVLKSKPVVYEGRSLHDDDSISPPLPAIPPSASIGKFVAGQTELLTQRRCNSSSKKRSRRSRDQVPRKEIFDRMKKNHAL